MLNNLHKKRGLLGSTILFGCVGVMMPVHAATTDYFDEIVVTAQKRTESLQDVPFAISAISQNTLDNAGINSLEGFAYRVPGLAISGQSSGRTQINIRGISSGEIRRDNTRASETVGVYFDEIPLSTALYNPDLVPFDLERVEVLRGPQGTLYGSGSLAGTIRLVSNMPVMNEFEGLVDASIASTEHGGTGYSIKGVVNVPLVEDVLAARLVAYQLNEAGWVDNLSDGPAGGKDVNETEKWGVRASFLWTPSERLTIRPTYIHQSIDSDGTSADNVEAVGVARLIAVGTLTADQAFDPSGKYEQWKYLGQRYNDEVDIGNLLAEFEFDDVLLTSSSSFTKRKIRVSEDLSDNNLAGGFFPAPPPSTGGAINVLGIGVYENRKIESFSQELRLSSVGDSRLQWIAGAYYSNIKVDYAQHVAVTDPRGIVGVPSSALVTSLYSDFDEEPGVLLRTLDDLKNEQVAVFGEANYHFTDKLAATIGLRWFDVKQTLDETVTGLLNGGTISFMPTTKDNGVNPKFLISYEASDDVLVSVQASKGFRLGGPQLFVPQVSTPSLDCPAELSALGVDFDPSGFGSESVWNYEAALKSTWMGGTITFNASAFYIDYSNLQITTRLACGFSFTENAASAKSRGVEFELEIEPVTNLLLSFGGSYLKAELTSDLPSGEAFSGDELPFVPNLKLSANIAYYRPISDTATGFLNLSYQYTGKVQMFFPMGSDVPITRSPEAESYHVANVRIGVELEQVEVALFVNNLWDEYGVTYISSLNRGGPGGFVTDTTIRPRTFGVNTKIRF